MSGSEGQTSSSLFEAAVCCVLVPLIAVGIAGGVVAACYLILAGMNPGFAP